MRKYYYLLLVQTKNAFTYRAEGFVYFMADFMTPILMMVVWAAAFSTRQTLGAYTLNNLLFYYLIVFVLRTIISVYPHEVSSRYIRRGGLSNHLLRPLNVIAYQLASEVAWKIIRLGFLAFSVLFLIKTFGITVESAKLSWQLLLLFPILVSGLTLNFFIKMSIEFLAFWTSDVEGIRRGFYVMESFFAGAVLPLEYMPKEIMNLSNFLPFKYFYYFPAKIIMGDLTSNEITLGLSIMILWLMLFILMTKIIYHKGLMVYTAVSG